VGEKKDLYSSDFYVSELNWISIEELKGSGVLNAKIRSSHPEVEATLIPLDKENVHVIFKEPQCHTRVR
jgi:tRNA U34 2-thiouridine synthase MnmA/TrmU